MTRGRKDYEKAVIAVESEGRPDLHGRTLMNDDFEDTPLKWATAGLGDWFASRQARAAYNGSFGLELDITSNIPPVAQWASADRYIPIDVAERLRVEMFWRANDLTRLYMLVLTLDYHDGAREHFLGIRYTRAAAAWDYWVSAGGWAAIPGSNQIIQDVAWNELTLSGDFGASEYIRIKSNNMEINMQGLHCTNPLSAIGAHVHLNLSAWNDTANQLIVSIDDIAIKEVEH